MLICGPLDRIIYPQIGYGPISGLIKSQQGMLLALNWREPLELDTTLGLLRQYCTTFYQDGAWRRHHLFLIYKDSYSEWVVFCDALTLNCAPVACGLSHRAQLEFAKSWLWIFIILKYSLCGSALCVNYMNLELLNIMLTPALCCVLPTFANPSQFLSTPTTHDPNISRTYHHYVAYSPNIIFFTGDIGNYTWQTKTNLIIYWPQA